MQFAWWECYYAIQVLFKLQIENICVNAVNGVYQLEKCTYNKLINNR
jgi:hypothetical protein